ncbi:MAG: 50S ribosomal protein L4 [Coprobacillus sp.]|nr:50S ribosomal protein L4 [Coprobacillus sp.]
MKKTVSLKVLNTQGEEVDKVTLDGTVFDVDFHEQAVFNAVMVETSNSRQATAKTKGRSEVRGGGRKPWRQKGTGRARAGSTRSPIWVGGGTTFGPTGEQNYKLSQNKKEYALAKRSALSQAVRENLVTVVDSLTLEQKKTKEFVKILDAVGAGSKVLVIVPEIDENLNASARNLNWVKVVDITNVSVYDILNVDTLIFTKEAITKVEEGLK